MNNILILGAGASIPFYNPRLSTGHLTTVISDQNKWNNIVGRYTNIMGANVNMISTQTVLQVLNSITLAHPNYNFEQIIEIYDKISSFNFNPLPNSKILHDILQHYGATILVNPVILMNNYFSDKDFYTDISDQNIIISEKTLFLSVECIIISSPISEQSNYDNNKREGKPKTEGITLFCSGHNNFFDTSYNHAFFRFLDSKQYYWNGTKNTNYIPRFSAGLVILR